MECLFIGAWIGLGNPDWKSYCRVPYNRFLMFSVNYLFFALIIICTAAKQTNDDRLAPLNWNFAFLVFYAFSFFARIISKLFATFKWGTMYSYFFIKFWRIYDGGMTLSLFLFVIVRLIRHICDPNDFSFSNRSCILESKLQNWSDWEDVFLAFATIMAISRYVNIIHRH